MFKIRKRYILLFSALAIFAIAISLPNLVKSKWEKKLQLTSLQKNITQQIRQETKLKFSIQGIHLDLMRGIVLKGLNLKDEKQSYHFYAENAIIKFYLSSLFSLQLRMKSIRIDKATLQVATYNFKTIEECKKSLMDLYHNSKTNISILQLPISLSNLYFTSLKKRTSDAEKSFLIHMSFWPKKQTAGSPGAIKSEVILKEEPARFTLTAKPAHSQKEEDWSIEIKTKDGESSHIRFETVPLRLAGLLRHYYDWHKETIFMQLERLFQAKKTVGNFTGKGKLQSSVKGKQFQLQLNYNDLSLNLNSILFPKEKWFDVRKKKGSLKFQIRTYHTRKFKEKKEDEAELSDFSLEIQQANLKCKLIKKNLLSIEKSEKATKNRAIYSIAGAISFAEKNLVSSKVKQPGRLIFDFKLQKKGNTIYPKGKFYGENIALPIATSYAPFLSQTQQEENLQNTQSTPMEYLKKILANVQKKIQGQKTIRDTETKESNLKVINLVLDKFSFEKEGYAKKAYLKGSAHWLATKLDLKGESELTFITTSNGIYLKPKLDLQIKIENLPLKSMINVVNNSSRSIRKKNNQAHIRKVLHNEFINSQLYRFLLANLQLKLQLNLARVQAAYPIPRSFHLQATINPQRFQMELIEPKTSEDFLTHFRYSIYFQPRMPRHEIQFSLYLDNNKNTFASLTGTKKTPQQVNMNYRYDGYGLSFTDLLHNSYSSLKVNTKGLSIANKKQVKVMIYAKGFTQKEIELDTLSINRNCKGIYTKFYFNGKSPLFHIMGSSDYNIGVGGQANYTIVLQNQHKNNTRSQHSVRILASGKWIPKL